MTQRENGRRAETILVLRLSLGRTPEKLTEALTTIRRAGGDLRLHVLHATDEGTVVSCVCENAAEAALALEEQGIDASLETAVWVQTEDRPGALGHLVCSVEVAGVRVGASFGASTSGELCAVLQTDDNPKAEDALRAYLDLRT